MSPNPNTNYKFTWSCAGGNELSSILFKSDRAFVVLVFVNLLKLIVDGLERIVVNLVAVEVGVVVLLVRL